ncbi:MAG TPA: hypothetical protein VGP90_00560, partial [Acidimicrobiia bacterium]|nr:hypothetical protein [Acidimicrobiia bacterium]
MNEQLVALRAVAVVRWLRRHPLVEAGPGVRASQALAELASAGMRMSAPPGDGPKSADAAFLRAALVAVPHRMRARPGV